MYILMKFYNLSSRLFLIIYYGIIIMIDPNSRVRNGGRMDVKGSMEEF